MARCTSVTTVVRGNGSRVTRRICPPGPPPEYKGGYIQRVDLRTGQFSTLYDSCDGKPLNSPNDLVFDSTGGFWFTTLGYFDGENRRLGAVYYARAGWLENRPLAQWLSTSPNGIGLSPDETQALHVGLHDRSVVRDESAVAWW